MNKTTIQIRQNTLERLKSFKKFERQPYDDVLNSIFDAVEGESLSAEEIEEIKQALDDVKRGKVYSIEHVAKELGIRLR